jgi:NAD(P)-dependent dehydrogenase (short-subunit alcohol dehydrogenase family)
MPTSATASAATTDTADFLKRYGSWALISGASEGTGAEFALQVAAKGLNVVLVARRVDKLEDTTAANSANTSTACAGRHLHPERRPVRYFVGRVVTRVVPCRHQRMPGAG